MAGINASAAVTRTGANRWMAYWIKTKGTTREPNGAAIDMLNDIDGAAVDDSDRMLAEVRHARTVRARIEDLRLTEKFDAVLLPTNLIHYRGVDLRRAVLATVAHHLKPTGRAIIGVEAAALLGRSALRLDGN
jgi:hypothetical protein